MHIPVEKKKIPYTAEYRSTISMVTENNLIQENLTIAMKTKRQKKNPAETISP